MKVSRALPLTHLLPRLLCLLSSHGNFDSKPNVLQVSSDAQALQLMNDSPYGLTASIWMNTNSSSSESERAFEALADGLETGTVFLNRCVNMFELGPLSLSLSREWFCIDGCALGGDWNVLGVIIWIRRWRGRG